jgi:hypothetical protein
LKRARFAEHASDHKPLDLRLPEIRHHP